jgi:hypothetical protein
MSFSNESDKGVDHFYLCIACLESKVEEATNAILGGSRRKVHDEAEAANHVSDGHNCLDTDLPFAFPSVLLNDRFA